MRYSIVKSSSVRPATLVYGSADSIDELTNSASLEALRVENKNLKRELKLTNTQLKRIRKKYKRFWLKEGSE